MCTLTMMDRSQQRKQKLISVLAEPMRQWLGNQALLNRDAHSLRKFYCELAEGRWLQPAVHTVTLLFDATHLEGFGVSSDFLADGAKIDVTSPLIVEEDTLMDLASRFALQLCLHRVKQCLPWSSAVPNRFASFLSDDETRRQDALRFCKTSYECFLAAKEVNTSLVKKMVARSFWHWPVNVVMAQYGAMVDWSRVTPMMRRHAANMLDPAMGQSKVIEDWAQRARLSESESKAMRCKTSSVWFAGIKTRLLGDVHKWTEIAYDTEDHASGNKFLPAGIYKASDKACSVRDLYADFTKGEAASWPVWSAQTNVQMSLDTALFKACVDAGDWQLRTSVWQSCLVVTGTVFSPPGEVSKWYISLGAIQKVVVCGWPLLEIKGVAGKKFFVMAQDISQADLLMSSVVDPSKWKCYKVAGRSPKHVWAATGGKMPHTWHTRPSPVCEALDKWTPLLQHAAWACFYDIPCAPIKQLCRRLGGSQMWRLLRYTTIVWRSSLTSCLACRRRSSPRYYRNVSSQGSTHAQNSFLTTASLSCSRTTTRSSTSSSSKRKP